MIVECIKEKFDYPKSIDVSCSNMTDWIVPGEQFLVFALKVSNQILYYSVIADGKLMDIPQDLFKIVEPTVSKFWQLDIDKFGNINFCPELFNEDYFLDKLTDYEEKKMKQFRKLKKLMEEEFDYLPIESNY